MRPLASRITVTLVLLICLVRPLLETFDHWDRAGSPQAFRHIEMAPILRLESGGPVNPLTGLDSKQSHGFPLSARPLGFGRDSLNMPAQTTMDLRVLEYFPFRGAMRLDVVRILQRVQ
jgi:hypothetical protein